MRELTFQFEDGTITLVDGKLFTPKRDAVDRWVVRSPGYYEALGEDFTVLYEAHGAKFILVEYLHCTAAGFPRYGLHRITDGHWCGDITRAELVTQRQALDFLLARQFEPPASLAALIKGRSVVDPADIPTGDDLGIESESNGGDRSDSYTSRTPPTERSMLLFVSYSHKDESHRSAFDAHLAVLQRQGVLEVWHDRKITAGDEWAQQIDKNLECADLIVLLVSADFLASNYCYDAEMKRALERHKEGTARVLPVIVRACDWKASPVAMLQALPTDAKPITSWPNQDEAWLDVADGIRHCADKMCGRQSHRA